MKKIISLCLCFMLLVLGAVPALAAADVTMTLKTDQQTLKPGDQVTVSLDIAAEKDCNAFGMIMVFDKQVFEVVSGKCSANAFFKNFHPERGFAVSYLGASKPNGKVGTVTLQVRADAPAGEATFTGKTSVKTGNDSLECAINTLTFQIAGQTTQATQPQQTQKPTPTVPKQPQETQPETTQQTAETTEATLEQTQEQTQSSDLTQTLTTQKETTQLGDQVEKPVEKKNDVLLIAVIAVAAVAAMAVGGYFILKKKR